MSRRRFLTSGHQRPMPRIQQPRSVEPVLRKVRNARPAAPRGSSAYPEGRPTAAHAKTAAWRLCNVIPVAQPNRENALPEASLREIATPEAPQRVGRATQEAPPEVNAAKAAPRLNDRQGMIALYFAKTSSQKPGSFRKNRS